VDYSIEITLTDRLTDSVITTDQSQRAESQQVTTPDKLGGILACLEAGAVQLDASLKDLLKQTKAVTLFAPDLISGALANKTGARIGLVVTHGYEATAYGLDFGPNPLIGSIVSKELITGITEATNEQGQQVLIPEIEEVTDRFRHLLELGSGVIVVSFKHACLNPANERLLQDVMRSDYPRHYLGAVPILLASDFSHEQDDLARTNICLLNAYTWFSVDQTLRRIETVLRQHNYRRSLLVAQTDGPAVPIPKVTPIKMCGREQWTELNKYIVKRET
jgi:N-methylhydantoinase A/oxoprolinase/acetone carboxylase beta subunit